MILEYSHFSFTFNFKIFQHVLIVEIVLSFEKVNKVMFLM